jgi:uncharacterized membrane protein YtjA (UPF0391 family)
VRALGFNHIRISTYLSIKSIIIMLRWSVTFLVIAIIAGVLGFGGIAAGSASIAKILFFIFVILFVVSLLTGKRVFNK